MAGLVLLAVPRSGSAALVLESPAQAATIARTPRRLPAGFEENDGQAPQDVKFLGSVGGHRVFFTSEGVQFTLVKLEERPADASGEANPLRRRVPEAVARVGLLFDGASPEAHVVGGDLLPGRVSYLVGQPSDWRRDIPLYARVRYEAVYPGSTRSSTTREAGSSTTSSSHRAPSRGRSSFEWTGPKACA